MDFPYTGTISGLIEAERLLRGYGLDFETMAELFKPTLPDHTHLIRVSTNGSKEFYAVVLYLAGPSVARRHTEADGFVASFSMDIIRKDYTTAPSAHNREVGFCKEQVFDGDPHPELFNPIADKVKALVTGHLEMNLGERR